MSDIDILHQMIKESARIFLSDIYGKKQLTLSEPQHEKSSVTIRGVPESAIIIKADAFKSPDTVFNGLHGECKRSDFVIIADTDNKKIILFIEMKARKGSEKEIIQQLTGAQCFIAYCREIGKAFWNQKKFLDDYAYRFVSIGHTGIPKRKTRISRQVGVHDCPERMLKIDSPHHLQFNHLAGV